MGRLGRLGRFLGRTRIGGDDCKIERGEDRALLLVRAVERGYPRLQFGPGQAVAGGEQAWTTFVRMATPERLRAVVQALEQSEGAGIEAAAAG
jgi:hypothetical protein